ncbi:MAG TPA: hypothetical protein VMF03_06540 [Steroidobacteraceae bacterium]|nr:hypothetical protein [Steroidobacteraceae bacterium]
MIRSVLAILAGIVTLTLVSFGIEALADPLLARSGLAHSLPAMLFMYGYGILSVAAGGYVSAWLAARAPLRHALWMGLLQCLLTLLAMTAMWNHAPAVNWIVALLMALPAALLGGWLYARRRNPGELHSSASSSV